MLRSNAIKSVTERRPNSLEVYAELELEADHLDHPSSPPDRFVTELLQGGPEFSDEQLDALEEYLEISGSMHGTALKSSCLMPPSLDSRLKGMPANPHQPEDGRLRFHPRSVARDR